MTWKKQAVYGRREVGLRMEDACRRSKWSADATQIAAGLDESGHPYLWEYYQILNTCVTTLS